MKTEGVLKPLFSQRGTALNVKAEGFAVLVITKQQLLTLLQFKEGKLV